MEDAALFQRSSRTPSFRLVFLSCLLLTLLVYGRSLFAPFHYDDRWTILHNPSLRQVSPLSRFFLDAATVAHPESGIPGRVYRPLATLSFAIDYKFWKLRSVYYRFENFLFHALGCSLVFLLLVRRCGIPAQAAGVGALLFLLHPAQAESVVWITQRSNLFCLTGMIASLLLLTGKPTRIQASLGLVFAALSLLSKETGAILIGLLALHHLSFKNEKPSPSETEITEETPTAHQSFWRHAPWRLSIGIIAMTGLYVVQRSVTLGRVAQRESRGGGWFDNLLVGAASWWEYLKLILAPIHLTVSHDQYFLNPWQSHWPWIGIFSFAVFATLAAGLWKKRARTPAFFMAWIVIGLLPVLGLIPIDTFVAERFLYVPMVGVSGLAAWLWHAMSRPAAVHGSELRIAEESTPEGNGSPRGNARLWKIGRFALRGILLMWLLWLGTTAFRQTGVWRDELSLWQAAVNTEPTNAFARSNLADIYSQRGDLHKAISEYRTALNYGPSLQIAFAIMNNLAKLFNQLAEPQRSLEWSERALKIKPDSVPTLYNQIVAYTMLGEKENAVEMLQKAEGMAPGLPIWGELRDKLTTLFGEIP